MGTSEKPDPKCAVISAGTYIAGGFVRSARTLYWFCSLSLLLEF
jgi:hypothetical protein